MYDKPARRCVLWPAGWISSVRQTQPVNAVLYVACWLDQQCTTNPACRRCDVACWLDQQCTTNPACRRCAVCGLLVGSAVYDKPSPSTCAVACWLDQQCTTNQPVDAVLWPAGWISSVRQTQPVDVCCGLLVGSAVYDQPACRRCAVACWLDQQCTTNQPVDAVL